MTFKKFYDIIYIQDKERKMNKKKLKETAELLVKYEQEKNLKEMEKLACSLSLEDMLQVDEYIIEKKLLTK